LFIWENINDKYARFNSTVIATLIQDITDGKDLDYAVRGFEGKVAPTTYKRPTSVISPRMVEDAMKTLRELDLENAIARRFANISDVSVNNVLFVDNSVKGLMKDGIEGILMAEATSTVAKQKDAVDISIDDFMESIMPKTTSIDLVLNNSQMGNFVSLTAPVHDDVNSLFQWDNNFAWSYMGNITDSIKEKVKKAGGNVNARMRVSLSWFNLDDLDIHVHEPDGNHIYYGNKENRLDVDMNIYNPVRDAVENVSWNNNLMDGTYKVYVNNYTKREASNHGFVLEVEFEGAISQFAYDRPVSGDVRALKLIVKNGILIDIIAESGISSSMASKEKWNVKTNVPTKVATIMKSPNYWDDNASGNKHWFFILDGCLNDEPTRGIYNEFLRPNLIQHRKVFEVLGEKTKCPVVDKQLSGVGFSSTRKDQVTLVCKGPKMQQTYNVKF
jgi:hypothetical protein